MSDRICIFCEDKGCEQCWVLCTNDEKKRINLKRYEDENNWNIYILECSDKSLYTGSTNNVSKRFEDHNSGSGAKYTKARLPVKLLFQKKIGTKSEACKEEYRIKQLSRTEKLELIKS